jgi:hypothetical protein
VCPQAEDRGDHLQIWWVPVSILNKLPWTAGKGWISSLAVGCGPNNPSQEEKKTSYKMLHGALNWDRLFGTEGEEMKQEIRAGQEHMQEMTGASQEKMEAIIQSIRSERDETRVENIMWRVNHKTQRSLQKACHEAMEADTEKIQPDPRMMQSIVEHQEVPM